MSIINLLPPHVADLIAAGEVVERPAAAVKELLENSIDAGAKNITVEIRSGGVPYIRVTDDGCGMSPSDAGTAFLRHATSKLKDAGGLEAIFTLGFRGEALAAIAAVSRIELLTRERGADSGTRVTLDRGDIMEMGDAGCPEGTTIIVRDLFFNTPARLKFLKSDRAESMAASAAALRTVLGRPDISVRFIKDGKEEFFTPGDGQALSCIYALFGREFASELLETETQGGISVSGFVSSPAHGRGNRAAQYFFINGRAVRSQRLQAALENAYKNALLTGRFPQCVLYIDISPALVDVNVHPTKAEVKFSDERAVFDAVYGATRAALTGEARPAEFTLSRTVEKAAGIAPESRGSVSLPRESEFNPARSEDLPHNEDLTGSGNARPYVREPFGGTQDGQIPLTLNVREPNMAGESRTAADYREYQTKIELPARMEPTGAVSEISDTDFRIAGEALGTYIIAEWDGELVLIDKHAAHERVIFDRIMAEGFSPMRQSLISPVTVTPPDGGAEALIKNAAFLEELGIMIEKFGENSVIIRAVPADTDAADARSMLEEICEALASGGNPEGRRDSILHTIACKAAIKAGKISEPAENRALAARVLSGEIKYCPHGRPVALTLTKKELDRHFRR